MVSCFLNNIPTKKDIYKYIFVSGDIRKNVLSLMHLRGNFTLCTLVM